MKRRKMRVLYPVLIVLVLIGVAVSQRAGDRRQANAEMAALKASPYWEPWEASGHAWCQSEIDIRHPMVPFTFTIHHPPGDRELVMETMRRLERTGPADDEPWFEETVQRFLILETHCNESWEELYGMLRSEGKSMVRALLMNPENPSEADYRQAILRVNYTKMGTVDAALEWYPPAED